MLKKIYTQGNGQQPCKYRILADEILAWNGLKDSSHIQEWGMGRRLDTRYGNVKMEWTYLASKVPCHEGHLRLLPRGILPVPEVHTHSGEGTVVVPKLYLLEACHPALLGEVQQQGGLPLVGSTHRHQLDATIRLGPRGKREGGGQGRRTLKSIQGALSNKDSFLRARLLWSYHRIQDFSPQQLPPAVRTNLGKGLVKPFMCNDVPGCRGDASWRSGTFPGKCKYVSTLLIITTDYGGNERSNQAALVIFVTFRKLLYSCTEGTYLSSACPPYIQVHYYM